ncbi:hypothetical protein TNCT_305991 [Trichonephila clavata]|uniref:Uncharacterized protein n=1 Tax=Trichonephila clavata TaxID=2740835 RepID=A0A8X6GBL8_TRICU|nr:hypothetical protein TNCT_305991 [Trichonephila clavata]
MRAFDGQSPLSLRTADDTLWSESGGAAVGPPLLSLSEKEECKHSGPTALLNNPALVQNASSTFLRVVTGNTCITMLPHLS